MDALDTALYDLVHDFKHGKLRGASALGRLTNANPTVINNKVCASQEHHHVMAREMLAWMLLAEDYRPLFALNAACGFAAAPLGAFENCSDIELLDKVLDLNAKRGEFDAEVRDALADGRIDHDEKQRIRSRMQAIIRALLELNTRIEALAEADAAQIHPRSVPHG